MTRINFTVVLSIVVLTGVSFAHAQNQKTVKNIEAYLEKLEKIGYSGSVLSN